MKKNDFKALHFRCSEEFIERLNAVLEQVKEAHAMPDWTILT